MATAIEYGELAAGRGTAARRPAGGRRRARRWFAAGTCVAALLTPALPAQAHGGHGGGTAAWWELLITKVATAPYVDVRNAERAGYDPGDKPVCVSSPAGGMGVHYANARLQKRRPEITRPAMLVYEPQASGPPQLVALEYYQVAKDPTGKDDSDRPTLFGQRFDGPITLPGGPAFYALHAWVWRHNAAGMFAMFNPAVSCPPKG